MRVFLVVAGQVQRCEAAARGGARDPEEGARRGASGRGPKPQQPRVVVVLPGMSTPTERLNIYYLNETSRPSCHIIAPGEDKRSDSVLRGDHRDLQEGARQRASECGHGAQQPRAVVEETGASK